jgi:hypothetical protein
MTGWVGQGGTCVRKGREGKEALRTCYDCLTGCYAVK